MGRVPCFSKSSLNRGSWSPDEDMLLKTYVQTHGVERWSTIAQNAGLRRSGKSCRLRWMNYLRPNVKLGHISADEEELIIRLHKLLGNRWSLIAGRVPGRTDNEVKNYWNIHLSKKLEKQSKIPIQRRNFRGNRSLETTDSEDPMGINSTDEDGNLNSRSVHAAATNTPQFSSPRDSTLTTPRDHNGPHRSDFCQCDSNVTDELIHTTIPSPVLDQVDISYEIRKMEGANDDQGVSTNGFENLCVESPCSDLYLSSVYSWADTLPWINGSVEMQDQWFHCSYI